MTEAPEEMMERVVVTKSIVGLCHMQVCAVADATDEEILEVCNRDNPSGTSNGWGRVLRADEEWLGEMMGSAPVVCADDKTRRHFLVGC